MTEQIVAHTEDHETIECPHCGMRGLFAPTTPPIGTLERPARSPTTRLASATNARTRKCKCSDLR